MEPRTREIAIRAEDRHGLLRDVTQLVSRLGISIIGNSGRVDPATGHAVIHLETRIGTLRELAILVDCLAHLDGVFDARVDPR